MVSETIIIYLLIYVFEGIISYIYFNDIFERKYKKSTTILLLIGFSLLAEIPNYLIKNIMFNIMFYFLVVFISSVLLFDAKWYFKLFYSSVLVSVMGTTELLAISFFKINETYYHTVLNPENNMMMICLQAIISKILYLVIAKLFSSIIARKKNRDSGISKRNITVVLFPLFIYAILSNAFYAMFAGSAVANKFRIMYSVISVLGMAFCAFILLYNEHIIEQERELESLRDEQQKIEINTAFYELLDKKNKSQRILVHDIKHHISTINSMDNVDEIKNYLASIQDDFDEFQFIGKSDNKMLDLILSRYSHICEKENIRFDVEIRGSNLGFINNKDLITILSNLLDNAVEAARGAQNAFILLETKNNNSLVGLNVINSSSHKPKSDGEKLFSTKADKGFHGFGTKSIVRTAKKYDGECNWYFDDEKFEFHYNILFNPKL